MKRKTRFILSLAVILPMLTVGVAWADEGTNTTTSSDQETGKTTMSERIESHKTAFKTRLSTLQQANIKAKCKNAQGIVKSTSVRIKGVETSRKQVYTNLVNRLTKMSTQLKDQGLDTTTLDSQIDELKTKIATFETDMSSYQQAISDLQEMNCMADPTGFKASLEAARTARAQVLSDSVAIKDYVKNTIKPTLEDLHKQLESQEEQ
ncbi:MAG TPA: hypothetical protein VLG25_02440 [Patescibacteria group bacterium]|nr:hypothetical protein [Patescibacteria group bacterium]